MNRSVANNTQYNASPDMALQNGEYLMKNGKRQIAWFSIMLMVLTLIFPMGTTVSFARKKKVKLKKIVLNHSTYKLQKGKSLKLKASFKPKKTTQKKITWKSSNKKVASVSKKGVVKARKLGTAKITAKVKGTKKKAVCKIQVVLKKSQEEQPNSGDGQQPQVVPESIAPAGGSVMPPASEVPVASPTPKYDRPATTAEPFCYFDLKDKNLIHTEGLSENDIVWNEDGTVTITFTQQYSTVNFYLPDNAQNYYSNYKYIQFIYKSTGGNLGHALYDAQMEGAANPSAGKHPDWGSKIQESPDENTLWLEVTDDCVGGCIRGLQIFNPNEMQAGQSITITISGILFAESRPTICPTSPPEASGVPSVSEQPGASQKPGESQLPGVSQKPGQSQLPGASQKPGQSQLPGVSQKPGGSQQPGVSQAPSVSAIPGSEKPGETAPPVKYIDLTAEGAFKNEMPDGASVVNNPDGSITITFSKQFAALNFYLPDNVQNNNSNYKSVVLTYTCEGGNLGHALYDADSGKHPDWGKKITESQEEKTLVFAVTNDCVGGCIRGFQIFNPNEMQEGSTITITVKSMIFSNKENPTPDDLNPSPAPVPTPTPTVAPTEPPLPIMTREPGPHGINGPTAVGEEVTWDCITFGSYYQSAYTPKQAPASPVEGNEYTDSDETVMIYQGGAYYKKEPIKWRVLSVDGDDAFLVADQNLDTQPYHADNCDSMIWENSSIRKWLNGEFFSSAFTDEEQRAILQTTVSTEKNPQYATEGGADTSDKVYLLSADEAKYKDYGFAIHYDKTSGSRQAKNSAYALGKDVWSNDSEEYADNGWWWLRSPGSLPFKAAYVGSEGFTDYSGFIAVNTGGGVRPVLHLNLCSVTWTEAGKVSSNSASDLLPTPIPTENPVKEVALSGVRIDPSECGSYDIDTDTISINDTRTGEGESTFMYFPIPMTVSPGETLRVTISGPSWGSNDFRIWTTPAGSEGSGDFVENSSTFLDPKKNADGSYTGTVEVTAKDRECNRITLKAQWGVKIEGLVISKITVERVKSTESAP